MYKLRLIKALSYSGAVSATRDNPYVDTNDKAAAEAAVASGYFEYVETPAEEGTAETPAEEGTAKPLSEMTKAELETCATYYGISTKGMTKAEIIEAIEEAVPAAASGVIDYGSPTMVDLQK